MKTEQELIKKAWRLTAESNSSAFRLGRILFASDMLSVFCLGYSYFRWLDDLVDDSNVSREIVVTILDRQKLLIQSFYYDEQCVDISTLNYCESMLHVLIQYDKNNGFRFQNYLNEMFNTLVFDAKRRYCLCNQHQLKLYSERLGRAYTNVLQLCTLAPDIIDTIEYSTNIAGYAAHQAHVLRDFFIDVPLGYYNISKEELCDHRWTLEMIKQVGTDHLDLRPWVENRVCHAFEAFEQGLYSISTIPNWRCRILGYATSAQYIYILNRIKLNNYQLMPNYKFSRMEKFQMLSWASRATFVWKADTATIFRNSGIDIFKNSY